MNKELLEKLLGRKEETKTENKGLEGIIKIELTSEGKLNCEVDGALPVILGLYSTLTRDLSEKMPKFLLELAFKNAFRSMEELDAENKELEELNKKLETENSKLAEELLEKILGMSEGE